MTLSALQIMNYHKNGYLMVENVFQEGEVQLLTEEMHKVIYEDCPRRILEKSGAVRSFFAPEMANELFSRVVRLERLVAPASQLINDRVYVHQTKLNIKEAMVGDWWEWHQDYTFWKQDDGMPKANVLTAMIYLTEVTEFNGPLLLIPGSHTANAVDAEESNRAEQEGWFSKYQQSTTYMSALTANLKYTLKQKTIAEWAESNGMHSAKGPVGSVLFFHGNVFHASSNNLSPWPRYTFLITYNSVNNQLQNVSNPRPEFIAQRNYTPITIFTEDVFTELNML